MPHESHLVYLYLRIDIFLVRENKQILLRIFGETMTGCHLFYGLGYIEDKRPSHSLNNLENFSSFYNGYV
jgi:hypothetical protein